MADNYKLVNLKEIDDAAQSYGLGDHLETRFARKAMGLEQFGFSYQRFQPSFRQPFGHTHSEQEEVYVVLEGGGRVKVEDEIVDLQQWDAIRVPPGRMRQFESGESGMALLVMGGAPSGDGEIVNGWWAD